MPERKELLGLVPTATYGDHLPQEGERGGALHLSSILPALSSAIGHPVPTAVHDDPKNLQHALGFPDVRSAIVVLVDGLGFWNLTDRIGHAPYLRSLMKDEANRRPISTCAPSTTTAAMGTFGTGTCPGLTAMAGYTQLVPARDRLIQLIQFKDPLAPRTNGPVVPIIDPHDLQRQDTIFEALTAQGVRVTSSGLAKFKGSPLSEAALRGSKYIANVTPRERVRAAAEAARKPGLSYLYIRDADKVGHSSGWDSDKLIVITADHGMVNADPSKRIDIACEPVLQQGVRFVGGEPRAVMLYADDDPEAVAERWRDFLEDRALVRTKAQAMADGLFGTVSERVEPMLGDVIVQAVDEVTIVDSRTQADKATHLPSVHGSQTMMEMDIPCIVDVA